MLQVFALKYGERQTTACQFFFREASHKPVTLHFFVWLILGGPYPVLVDTGFRQEDAAEREQAVQGVTRVHSAQAPSACSS